MMTEISTIDGGQKDALLRKANINKNIYVCLRGWGFNLSQKFLMYFLDGLKNVLKRV